MGDCEGICMCVCAWVSVRVHVCVCVCVLQASLNYKSSVLHVTVTTDLFTHIKLISTSPKQDSACPFAKVTTRPHWLVAMHIISMACRCYFR